MTGACFIDLLTQQRAYPAFAVPLASVNASHPSKGPIDDAAIVSAALIKLVGEEGKERGDGDVFVRRRPGSVGVRGFGKGTREKEDKERGVLRMLFLNAFCVPKGQRVHISGGLKE